MLVDIGYADLAVDPTALDFDPLYERLWVANNRGALASYRLGDLSLYSAVHAHESEVDHVQCCFEGVMTTSGSGVRVHDRGGVLLRHVPPAALVSEVRGARVPDVRAACAVATGPSVLTPTGGLTSATASVAQVLVGGRGLGAITVLDLVRPYTDRAAWDAEGRTQRAAYDREAAVLGWDVATTGASAVLTPLPSPLLAIPLPHDVDVIAPSHSGVASAVCCGTSGHVSLLDPFLRSPSAVGEVWSHGGGVTAAVVAGHYLLTMGRSAATGAAPAMADPLCRVFDLRRMQALPTPPTPLGNGKGAWGKVPAVSLTNLSGPWTGVGLAVMAWSGGGDVQAIDVAGVTGPAGSVLGVSSRVGAMLPRTSRVRARAAAVAPAGALAAVALTASSSSVLPGPLAAGASATSTTTSLVCFLCPPAARVAAASVGREYPRANVYALDDGPDTAPARLHGASQDGVPRGRLSDAVVEASAESAWRAASNAAPVLADDAGALRAAFPERPVAVGGEAVDSWATMRERGLVSMFGPETDRKRVAWNAAREMLNPALVQAAVSAPRARLLLPQGRRLAVAEVPLPSAAAALRLLPRACGFQSADAARRSVHVEQRDGLTALPEAVAAVATALHAHPVRAADPLVAEVMERRGVGWVWNTLFGAATAAEDDDPAARDEEGFPVVPRLFRRPLSLPLTDFFAASRRSDNVTVHPGLVPAGQNDVFLPLLRLLTAVPFLRPLLAAHLSTNARCFATELRLLADLVDDSLRDAPDGEGAPAVPSSQVLRFLLQPELRKAGVLDPPAFAPLRRPERVWTTLVRMLEQSVDRPPATPLLSADAALASATRALILSVEETTALENPDGSEDFATRKVDTSDVPSVSILLPPPVHVHHHHAAPDTQPQLQQQQQQQQQQQRTLEIPLQPSFLHLLARTLGSERRARGWSARVNSYVRHVKRRRPLALPALLTLGSDIFSEEAARMWLRSCATPDWFPAAFELESRPETEPGAGGEVLARPLRTTAPWTDRPLPAGAIRRRYALVAVVSYVLLDGNLRSALELTSSTAAASPAATAATAAGGASAASQEEAEAGAAAAGAAGTAGAGGTASLGAVVDFPDGWQAAVTSTSPPAPTMQSGEMQESVRGHYVLSMLMDEQTGLLPFPVHGTPAEMTMERYRATMAHSGWHVFSDARVTPVPAPHVVHPHDSRFVLPCVLVFAALSAHESCDAAEGASVAEEASLVRQAMDQMAEEAEDSGASGGGGGGSTSATPGTSAAPSSAFSQELVRRVARWRRQRSRLPRLVLNALDAEKLVPLCRAGVRLAIDSEFVVAHPARVRPRVDGTLVTVMSQRLAPARVSLVTSDGAVVMDDYIAQAEQVVDYLTRFSGLRAENLDPGAAPAGLQTPRAVALKLRVLVDAGVVFVGHGLDADFATLSIRPEDAQVCDTVRLFRIPGQRALALRFLAAHLLRERVQDGAHDSVEDARTAFRLVAAFERLRAADALDAEVRALYQTGRETGWTVSEALESPKPS